MGKKDWNTVMQLFSIPSTTSYIHISTTNNTMRAVITIQDVWKENRGTIKRNLNRHASTPISSPFSFLRSQTGSPSDKR